MNSFAPVSRAEAIGDAANLGGTLPIPQSLLYDDHFHWAEVLANTALPVVERNKNLAAYHIKDSAKTLELAKAISFPLGHRFNHSERQQLMRYVSARYALSRLMGGLHLGNREYTGAGEAYEGTKDNKELVDRCYTIQDPAYSVIVAQHRLARRPFEGEPEGLSEGGQWYRNENLGLYVLAKSPARVSAVFLDDLTLDTGSLQAAEELIDAENSVNLQPYVSLAHIALAQ